MDYRPDTIKLINIRLEVKTKEPNSLNCLIFIPLLRFYLDERTP